MPNEYIHPSYQTQEDVLLRHDLIRTPDKRNRQNHPHRLVPASLVPVPLHRDSQEELATEQQQQQQQQSAILSLNTSHTAVQHPLQNFNSHTDDLVQNGDDRGNRTIGFATSHHVTQASTSITTAPTNVMNTSSRGDHVHHLDHSQFHPETQHDLTLPSSTEQVGVQRMIHDAAAPSKTRPSSSSNNNNNNSNTLLFHVPCPNSFTKAIEDAAAATVVPFVMDRRKRNYSSTLHSTTENHLSDGQGENGNLIVGQEVNHDGKVIKARKAFSLKEKLAYVMAFKRDCRNGNTQQMGGEEEDKDEVSEVIPLQEGSQRGYQQQRQMSKQSRCTTLDVSKTKKLKAWLKEKNQREGTNIAYATMYKWVKKYGKMDEERGSDVGHSSVGHLKKLRTRPYQELETILVEYLRVRNETLRKKGLPLSSVAFIKDRANMFYRDMYGNGDEEGTKGFKCSSGWVHRFKARYKDIFEPLDDQSQDASMEGIDLQYGITTTQTLMAGDLMLPQDASKLAGIQVRGQETAHLQFPTNPLAAPHLQGIGEESQIAL